MNGTSAAWQAPLLDLVLVFSRRRFLFFAALVLGGVQAYVSLRTTPEFFRSTALGVLLPREKPILEASIDTGALETSEDVARRAPSASLTLPPNTELYVALIRSSPFLGKLAERNREDLVSVQDLAEDASTADLIDALKSMITATGTEQGLLTVAVEAQDPVLSANLANDVLAGVEVASQDIERRLLEQQTRFLDQAARRTRNHLEEARQSLEAFSREHDLIDLEYQGAQVVLQQRALERELQTLRAELQARRLFYTEADPGVRELQEKLRENERGLETLRDGGALGVHSQEYTRLRTEHQLLDQALRYRRDLHFTLATQADIFRIRAEQPTGSLAVIRGAVPALEPAGPSKKLLLGIPLGLALFLAAGLAILLDQLERMREVPELSERMSSIRRELLKRPRATRGRREAA